MYPAQNRFIFLTLMIAYYDLCPLPDPDVGRSILVRDVEHSSFHFGMCSRTFALCLFGDDYDPCNISINTFILWDLIFI